MSSYGCNSCKNLDPNSKKPGRSGGYLFMCKATGKWVNAAKESCNYYEKDEGRTSYEINTIYKDSNEYSDIKPDTGCNSCANLDEKKKAPGEAGGYLYFCKIKNTYVDATQDSCENYKNGYRSNSEKNEIYNDSKNYKAKETPTSSLLFILVIMIIFAIIYTLFLK